MKTKRIYLGEDIEQKDWGYGLGSIYLGGPRNDGPDPSWRLDFMQKIESYKSPVSFFIPESKHQLKSGGNPKISLKKKYEWQNFAISMASAVVFWYPKSPERTQKDNSDKQGYVQFGAWYKAERTFYGRESEEGHKYLDWVYHKEQRLYPAENIKDLAEMVIHWVKE